MFSSKTPFFCCALDNVHGLFQQIFRPLFQTFDVNTVKRKTFHNRLACKTANVRNLITIILFIIFTICHGADKSKLE